MIKQTNIALANSAFTNNGGIFLYHDTIIKFLEPNTIRKVFGYFKYYYTTTQNLIDIPEHGLSSFLTTLAEPFNIPYNFMAQLLETSFYLNNILITSRILPDIDLFLNVSANDELRIRTSLQGYGLANYTTTISANNFLDNDDTTALYNFYNFLNSNQILIQGFQAIEIDCEKTISKATSEGKIYIYGRNS